VDVVAGADAVDVDDEARGQLLGGKRPPLEGVQVRVDVDGGVGAAEVVRPRRAVEALDDLQADAVGVPSGAAARVGEEVEAVGADAPAGGDDVAADVGDLRNADRVVDQAGDANVGAAGRAGVGVADRDAGRLEAVRHFELEIGLGHLVNSED